MTENLFENSLLNDRTNLVLQKLDEIEEELKAFRQEVSDFRRDVEKHLASIKLESGKEVS
jgi:hypothetical protein